MAAARPGYIFKNLISENPLDPRPSSVLFPAEKLLDEFK
jgi:hypothetical protein